MVKNKLCKYYAVVLVFFIVVCVLTTDVLPTLAEDGYKVYAEDTDIREYIGGTGTYFEREHPFYKDSARNIVYCVQGGVAGANKNGISGYTEGNAEIIKSPELVDRLNRITSLGYPNNYSQYVVGGTTDNPIYLSGLLIEGEIFQCTEYEARAATAFALHKLMIDNKVSYPDATFGNDITIDSYVKGNASACDIAALVDKLYSAKPNDEASIKIQWIKYEDDQYVESNAPVPFGQGMNEYMTVYARVVSSDCVVNNITLNNQDGYVLESNIKEIKYISPFERIIKIEIKDIQDNYTRSVGLECEAISSDINATKIMGNSVYQDVAVVTSPKKIKQSITGTFSDGKIGIKKLDYETKQPISGVEFMLYSDEECNDEMYILTTDDNGFVPLDNIKPGKYYIKELKCPIGYVLDESVYEIDIVPELESYIVIYNHRVPITIIANKVDKETGKTDAQGDADLKGAVYGVFAAENIMRIDGHSGLIAKKDDLVGQITIGFKNSGQLDGLYPGKYYLKELEAPKGYKIDEEIYPVDCTISDTTVTEVRKEITLSDEVKKQAFQLKKYYEGKNDEQLPLEGAGFTAWLISDLNVDADGNYIIDGCEPYPIGKDGEIEMFTDKDGYACSEELPYGTYLVRETTVPEGFLPIEDIIVTISEDSDTPLELGMLKDERDGIQIRISKKDFETGNNIEGAELVLLDETEYEIDRWISGKEEHTVDGLIKGKKYILREVSAPYGYLLAEDIEFYIDDLEELSIVMYDKSAKGKIIIHKTGEIIETIETLTTELGSSLGVDVSVKNSGLDGVEFKLYAAEDIYCSDGSKTLIYKGGEEIKTAITNEKGIAEFDDLPLGKYYIVETKTKPEYILYPDKVYVDIKYMDQYTEIICVEEDIYNERIKSEIKVIKKDGETGETIEGAVFAVYAAEDIYDSKKNVVHPKDYMVSRGISDINGEIIFDDIKFPGKYYVKEIEAPKGYKLNDEKQEINILAGENTFLEMVVFNYPKDDIKDDTTTEITTENKLEDDNKTIVKGEMETSQQIETGDASHPLIAVMLMLFVISALIIVKHFSSYSKD